MRPSAFVYHLQDVEKRASRVWREEGCWVFVRKIADKVSRIITHTQPDMPEYYFLIEVMLKNPLFDFSKIDVASQIRLDPIVSIVVPVYNGISFVPQCIRSFFQSPVSVRFEVILVDNASTDGTLESLRELASEHDNLILLENEINKGFAQAINQGAAAARGEFVAVCNSDIIVTPGWLDHLVSAMWENPSLAVVSPVTNYVGEGPQLDPIAEHVTPETANIYAQQVADRSGVQLVPDRLVFFCVLLRKQYFDFLGGISGVFKLGNYEDDDFCLRARMAGFTLGIVPGAFVFHYGSRTFKEQKIDHVQWMFKNERVYFERMAKFSVQTPLRKHAPFFTLPAPAVSVIVRTKDRPFALRRALTSLANQTFRDFEVVLVNDGGVDIYPILNEFESYLMFNYVANPTPTGRAAALNTGLAKARGQWITYLDDDDIVYPIHLELLFTEIILHGENAIVYSDVNKALCWSDDLQKDLVIVDRVSFTFKRYSPDELLVDNLLPIMSFMHSASLIEDIGPFDEGLGIFEDWEFLLRLAQSVSFHSVPRTTCEYRFRFGNAFNDSTLHMREMALQFRTIIYERYPVDDEELEKKRSMTIIAIRQQIEDVRRIVSLQLNELQRSLLIAARLGGFPLPDIFRD